MESTAKLLGSIASLIWPILASALVWRLIPTFTKVIEARSFTIKFAGMELSAQQATDQLATQIKDLQNKIAMLEGQSNTRTDVEAVESANTIPDATHSPKRILWVDDQPKNNAFEIARLKEDGWDIQQAVIPSSL